MRRPNNQAFMFVLLALGVVATAMIFLPALIYKDTDTVFTGIQSVFGAEFASLGIFGSGQMEPNILGMVAFALPVTAGILAVVFSRNSLIPLCVFIGAAILLFLLPLYAKATITVLGETTILDVTWTMGVGLIVSIGVSIGGAVISLVQMISQKQ